MTAIGLLYPVLIILGASGTKRGREVLPAHFQWGNPEKIRTHQFKDGHTLCNHSLHTQTLQVSCVKFDLKSLSAEKQLLMSSTQCAKKSGLQMSEASTETSDGQRLIIIVFVVDRCAGKPPSAMKMRHQHICFFALSQFHMFFFSKKTSITWGPNWFPSNQDFDNLLAAWWSFGQREERGVILTGEAACKSNFPGPRGRRMNHWDVHTTHQHTWLTHVDWIPSFFFRPLKDCKDKV